MKALKIIVVIIVAVIVQHAAPQTLGRLLFFMPIYRSLHY